MINIGIIGAGRMGRSHADALKRNTDYTLKGVYDPVPESARSFAETFSVNTIYAGSAELAADKSVDAVLICNYADQHHDTLVEMMDAGKQFIFCEKPLVRKLSDGEDILKRAEKSGTKIMVGHHRRYIPGYAKLRDIVVSGTLGKIRMAKVAFCHSSYNREWGTYFADFDRCGGVTLDNETHHIDLLNWYFGDPESVTGGSLRFPRDAKQPVDYVSGTLQYRNGVICNIDASWQRYGEGYDRMEIYGDSASAVYAGGDKVHMYLPGEHREFMVGSVAPYTEQMSAFLRMIKNGEAPRVTLRDGYNSARVALGLIEAAERNGIVRFN